MLPDYDDFLSITYYDTNKFPPTDMFQNGNYEIYVQDSIQLVRDLTGDEFMKRLELREIIIHSLFWGPLNHNDLSFVFAFLSYHFQKYAEKTDNGFLFLLIMEEVLKENPLLSEAREQTILEWITTQKKEFTNTTLQNRHDVHSQNKVTWHGSPSQLGYLFLELVKAGFIEPPLYGGEYNYTGLAKFCFNNFKVDTTQENLIKEMNPLKNTLSETKRSKFTIPYLSDLA